MTGWITTTGRSVGILTCSAMLLISVTLGQTSQASPARSIPPPAADTNGAVSNPAPQDASTATEPVVGSSSTTGSPSSTDEQHESSPGITASSAPATGKPSPQSGSGFTVPEDSLRFNKAVPVRMAPIRLQIPNAWVDARIQTVGITPDGQMEAPNDFWEVGWYRYGTRPGDVGKAVMAGHLDSYDGAAVFYHIGDLQPGDEIRILLGGPDGERFYQVREVAHYHVDNAPLDQIFGPSDRPELVLITCGGDWLGADAGGYTERIVVYADMITPGAPADPGPARDHLPRS